MTTKFVSGSNPTCCVFVSTKRAQKKDGGEFEYKVFTPRISYYDTEKGEWKEKKQLLVREALELIEVLQRAVTAAAPAPQKLEQKEGERKPASQQRRGEDPPANYTFDDDDIPF